MVKPAEFIQGAAHDIQERLSIQPQPDLPVRNLETTTLSQEEIKLLKLVDGYQIALRNQNTFLANQILSELYERCVDKIYRYFLLRVGNQQDAEDLTSRTFYKMVEHLPRFKSQNTPFSAWLYRIAHNLAANKFRDRSRADKYLIRLPELAEESAGDTLEPRSDADTAEQALANIQRQELYAEVLKLSEEYQKIIYLKLAGYSNAEIGTIIGKSEGAVKSLYHRAMLALREKMSDII